ncbi:MULTISPECIES: helix-turn-helix domain-containing protein [Bacillus cereus group]|uniref:helix-turn-helix domain-containing protein n=1 Tax=Bacillus cereus group TaxID=86661 RepID=UPI0011A7DC46|nr:helix-turn-helix transcriptional regulator [Bacillus thuringiensis]HDT6579472.1 helix-turn-helix transcriptional regulator [Bacillus cereus]
MEKKDNIFGTNLKRLRGIKGLSRKDLSKEINLPYSTITSWELGEKMPKLERIPLLAKFFGVTEAELLYIPLSNEEILEKDTSGEDPIKRLTNILYDKYKNVPDQYKPQIEKEILRYANLLRMEVDLKATDNKKNE